MFGSAALEVAIGMVLIFLLMCLIMTSVQEALHGFFKTRARTLERAIMDVLQDDRSLATRFYSHPLIYALHRGKRVDGKVQLPPAHFPSYIPRETFAATVLDLMQPNGAKSPHMKTALDGLKTFAGKDPAALRREVEGWYDAAMDRASGAFKRKSQTSLFLLGIGAAILFNVNAVSLAQYLSVNPQHRAFIAGLAESELARAKAAPVEAAEPAPAVAADPATNQSEGRPEANAIEADPSPATDAAPPAPPILSDERVRALTDQLSDTGLPIGWGEASLRWTQHGFPGGAIHFGGPFSFAALMAWLLLLAGYLITAFATMLGAPFWFDILNKIMVIRSTVKPKEKSGDEASEDRGGGSSRNTGAGAGSAR